MSERAAEALDDRPAPAPTSGRGPGALRSLRVRNFRLYFVGQLVSQTGTWMQSVALTWIVLERAGTGTAVGLVAALQFAPTLLLAPWSGWMVDRVPTLRLMVWLQAGFAVSTAGLVVVEFALPSGSLAWLYALALVVGVVNALDNPVRKVFVGELVPPAEVSNAVGLNGIVMTASRVTGPALAGFVIAGPGARWCFALNLASYVVVLGALARMDRTTFPPAVPHDQEPGRLRDGLLHVWADPSLRAALVNVTAVSVLAYQFEVVLPLLATDALGSGVGGFTALLSLLSVGSVLGGFWLARTPQVTLGGLRLATVGLGASLLGLSVAPGLAAAAGAAVPVGVCSMYVMSGTIAFVQLRVPAHVVGRAMALLSVSFIGFRPFGALVLGAAADLFDARVAVAVGAAACAIVVMAVRVPGPGAARTP